MTAPEAVELALESAHRNALRDQGPEQAALKVAQQALQETQKEIDSLVGTIASGTTASSLMGFLNERAHELDVKRESLRAEQRRLNAALLPLATTFDAPAYRKVLTSFATIAQTAEPQELQQMLQLVVRRIEWGADGNHWLELYSLGSASGEKKQVYQTETSQSQGDRDWFDISVRFGGPLRRTFEPLVYRLIFAIDSLIPTLEILSHA